LRSLIFCIKPYVFQSGLESVRITFFYPGLLFDRNVLQLTAGPVALISFIGVQKPSTNRLLEKNKIQLKAKTEANKQLNNNSNSNRRTLELKEESEEMKIIQGLLIFAGAAMCHAAQSIRAPIPAGRGIESSPFR